MAIERVSGLTGKDHGLDEIVGKNISMHLERMDHNHIWMLVTDLDGNEVTVNLWAKGTIKATVDQDRAPEGKSEP